MTAWNIIALPYARLSSVTDAIGSHLERGHPYRQVRPAAETLSGGELHQLELDPELGEPTIFTCYERPLLTSNDLTVFVEMNGRWDLELTAAISRATGGFAIAAESWRFVGRGGLAVFYAGELLELRSHGDGVGGGIIGLSHGETLDVDQRYRQLLGAATSVHANLIYQASLPSDDTVVEVLRCTARSGYDAATIPVSSALNCAFFAFVEADAMFRALESEPQRACSMTQTALGVPFGIVTGLGPDDDRDLHSLQQKLDTYALALSIEGGRPGAPKMKWWRAGPESAAASGRARNASELFRVLYGFTVMMGAQVGELRLPLRSFRPL